jgi:hypothetical protein
VNATRLTVRLDWLRLVRGPADFFVPAVWVRRVGPIERPVPLPLSEPWVLGLAAADDGRWLPVIDPLVAVGGQAPRRGIAALLAAPGGEPLAWLLADGPGTLAALADEAGEPHPALPWLHRLPNLADGRRRHVWAAAEWAAALAAA